ncbi:MAG: flagellar assembly protein FliW [Spirochaetes bacterium]|nr:flagellar assembly protein FliW [Spirochaetota bacterium]
MKKIKTKPFGEIKVDETQQITFPDGLFGFEQYKKFYLLENPGSPFLWLQSSEEPALAFILIQPVQFKADYKLEISQEDYKSIGLDKKDKKVLDFVIVTVPKEPEKMTANLQGPIIINVEKNIGKQVISLKEDYPIRCPVIEEMKKTAKVNKKKE